MPYHARVLRGGGRLYVYDFGFAPFGVLTGTAGERGAFGGPARQTRIRTGVWLVPRCERLTMTA